MEKGSNEEAVFTRYIWNHKLHEVWGNEDLFFIKLRFHPTYNREAILRAIKEVLYDYHVGSYALYEMTGEYDILLRFWLNRMFRTHAFEISLTKRLALQHLHVTDLFHVTQIVEHWVWRDADGLREPKRDLLEKGLPSEEVDLINMCQLNARQFDRYRQANIISPCTPGKGIKFVITIPKSEISAPPDARNRLIAEIMKLLKEETDVSEISIYAGHGFAQLLVMARIKAKVFDNVLSRIVMRINGLGLGEFLSVRTYTYVCLNSGGVKLLFHDVLWFPEQGLVDFHVDLQYALSQEESANLEVKGSAFVDVGKWLFTGKAERTNRITREGVLKAIVGFLNANGGTVVVGALEKDKYKNKPELKEKLKDFAEYDDYFIVGLELDYGKDNWDKFQLALENVLSNWIKPVPISWVRIVKEELQGKDLCVISVRQPTRGWFYVLSEDNNEIFYVRQGNSTRPLSGPEADDYKHDNPR